MQMQIRKPFKLNVNANMQYLVQMQTQMRSIQI